MMKTRDAWRRGRVYIVILALCVAYALLPNRCAAMQALAMWG